MLKSPADQPLDNSGVIAFPPLIWLVNASDQRSRAPIRLAADHELSDLSRLRDRLRDFGAYAGAVGLANHESGRNKRSPV